MGRGAPHIVIVIGLQRPNTDGKQDPSACADTIKTLVRERTLRAHVSDLRSSHPKLKFSFTI